MPSRFRRFWLMALIVLGANLFLSLTWWGTGVLFVAGAASKDPSLAKQIEQFQTVYQNDTENVSDSDAEHYAEALRDIFAPVDWFTVSMVSSAFAFSLLGLLAGRVLKEPRWVGVLPVAAVIFGQNPAILPTIMENQGLPGKHLSFPEQVGVFSVQMVCVYLFGMLGSRGQHKRRRRIYQCGVCGDVFVDEESCRRHEDAHLNER